MQNDPFHMRESTVFMLSSRFLTNAGFIVILASNFSKECGNLTSFVETLQLHVSTEDINLEYLSSSGFQAFVLQGACIHAHSVGQ